jgi:hypothetical protein
MPRPSSVTVTELSTWMMTLTVVAEAGQRLVDRVVDHLEDHVVQPEPSSVSPMYMPGRFRTASRPLSTLMLPAS